MISVALILIGLKVVESITTWDGMVCVSGCF